MISALCRLSNGVDNLARRFAAWPMPASYLVILATGVCLVVILRVTGALS